MLTGLLLATVVVFGEPTVAWQLGVCRGDGATTMCVRLGDPQPLEICQAMRDALRRESVERAVCARVLVDE